MQRFAKPFILPSTQTLLVPDGRFSWRWDWIKERVSEKGFLKVGALGPNLHDLNVDIIYFIFCASGGI